MRDLKIGIKDMKESAEEIRKILRQFDQGISPEQPVERIYFNDFKTLLRYITPKRLVLLKTLHKAGAMSINALAKLLNRSYKNVCDDIKVLELVGLVEQKRIFVPWNEIATTLRLAA